MVIRIKDNAALIYEKVIKGLAQSDPKKHVHKGEYLKHDAVSRCTLSAAFKEFRSFREAIKESTYENHSAFRSFACKSRMTENVGH